MTNTPMTNELKAAAARLRPILVSGKTFCFGNQYEYDVAVVAMAALPLFDETAIERRWLLSVGAVKDAHPAKVLFSRDDSMAVGLWQVEDGWKAMLIHSTAHQSCIVRGLKTQGQFRLLARALSITLKEST